MTEHSPQPKNAEESDPESEEDFERTSAYQKLVKSLKSTSKKDPKAKKGSESTQGFS